MRDRKYLFNRVEGVVTADAISTHGPSPQAVEAIVRLGHWHGKHRKRWKPAEALLIRLAEQVVRRAASEDAEQVRTLDARLRRVHAEVQQVPEDTAAAPAAGAAVTADLMARRDAIRQHAASARRQSLLAEAEQLRAQRETADIGSVERIDALVGACRVLWSAYRVAYVEALPGSSDSQHHGPRIQLAELDLPLRIRRDESKGSA